MASSLTLSGINAGYGSVRVIENVSLSVSPAETVALLIRLNERGVTVILIEHIMRAVMRFSQRLVVLVAGRKIADGEPQSVMAQPDVVKAYLGE